MCLEAVPPNSVSRDPVLRKKMKHATALKSTNSTFRLRIGYARTTSLKSTGVISVRTLLCFFVVLLIFLYLTYFIFTILPLVPRYLEALAISDCFPLRISRIYLYWHQCCTPVISNNFQLLCLRQRDSTIGLGVSHMHRRSWRSFVSTCVSTMSQSEIMFEKQTLAAP